MYRFLQVGRQTSTLDASSSTDAAVPEILNVDVKPEFPSDTKCSTAYL
jgi:hypothetical protein